jgi:release factor glutamine methyltransferase
LNEFVGIDTALAEAVEVLSPVSDSARLDAELLLALALDVPRSYLITHPEDSLDPAAVNRFQALVDRRHDGEPMAYITGEKEFWSLNLMVSPATLVPRPETELLVERALREIPRREPFRVLDLGTGSGAIALAIAKSCNNCEVVATDVSGEALAVAAQNARQLDVANMTFLQGDWTEPVAGQLFDLIVSNPPYVNSDDPALQDLQHEPLQALAAGTDGLDAIRCISSGCLPLLQAGHLLMLEHGDQQAADVAAVLTDAGWAVVECLDDLAGRPRVTVAQR